MFGIGGGEILFILIVVLMLFGSDKVPEIARTLGKLMAQLKHATNDIKSEIQKEVEANGIDTSIKEITTEINSAKENFSINTTKSITDINKEIEEASGPIKRQL